MFIELTTPKERPVIVNIQNITTIEPYKEGARIILNGSGGDSPQSKYVKEDLGSIIQKIHNCGISVE